MELKPYTTLAGKGEGLYEDRRSEFIGVAFPVKDESEIQELIRSVKKQHPAARHNVWAYVLRSGAERYSDDGEPQGSAGVPVLEVLRKNGITDALIVVTRYFGGILLGTGGLVRAYSGAAKLAADDAGTVKMISLSVLQIECSYSDHNRIGTELVKLGGKVVSSEFGECVTLKVTSRTENAENICKALRELTAGRVRAVVSGEMYGAEHGA